MADIFIAIERCDAQRLTDRLIEITTPTHPIDRALVTTEVGDLPRRLDRILGEIERGNLRVWTRIEDMNPLLKRLEQVAARTNAAILVAACIIGLAMVIPFYHPQGWEAWFGVVFWIAVAAVVAGSIRTLWRLRK